MEPPDHERSMTSYDPKMIFRICDPEKSSVGIQKPSKRVLIARNTLDVEINNFTLKGQGQNLTSGQGHLVTQVGHIAYHSMRLAEPNAITPIPRVYLFCISSYWQKKLLVTSSDLDDRQRGQRRKITLEVSIQTLHDTIPFI